MAVEPPRVTPELTLLSRVAYRGREVAGPRPRGLLALLAGGLRTGAGTARLVEGLWPDEQPEHPAKALQVVVSRTRAQVGADVIASTPTGYRLSLADDQVDASAGLGAGRGRGGPRAVGGAPRRRRRGAGRPGGRAAGRAGLDLPVAGPGPRAGPGRLGRHAEAAEPLADLARERPRDEEVLVELLRSQAATQGPSAALARYEAYRRSLRDELGTDPGPALQDVQQQLLQGSSPVVRQGVPHEPNPLLGRDSDIAAVANLLRTPESPPSSAPAAWARPAWPRR
jgi:hypothetical protein